MPGVQLPASSQAKLLRNEAASRTRAGSPDRRSDGQWPLIVVRSRSIRADRAQSPDRVRSGFRPVTAWGTEGGEGDCVPTVERAVPRLPLGGRGPRSVGRASSRCRSRSPASVAASSAGSSRGFATERSGRAATNRRASQNAANITSSPSAAGNKLGRPLALVTIVARQPTTMTTSAMAPMMGNRLKRKSQSEIIHPFRSAIFNHRTVPVTSMNALPRSARK